MLGRPRLGRTVAALVVLLAAGSTVAALPETSIRYEIEVRVDPETHELSGRERIVWTNRSATTIDALRVHLYLNGFAHEGTTWMRESYPDAWNRPGWQARYDDPWGYIEPTAIRQLDGEGRGVDAPWKPIRPDDGNPLDRSLIEVRLPRPVSPGGTAELEVEFEGRLSHTIARTGCVRGFCMVAQWYPKIGVLEYPGVRGAETTRWAARQFHGPTEFYADFADYDVTIDMPEGWLIGSTGRQAEVHQRAEPERRKVRFLQRAVHDFAFALGRDYEEEVDFHQPPGVGPEVEIRYLVPRLAVRQIERLRRATTGALDVMAERVGPYPYDTLTIVLPVFDAHGADGMEYPTLFTSSGGDPLFFRPPLGNFPLMAETVVHEFAHQYFQGLVATNEQEEAYLDEGFTQYWEAEGMREIFGREPDEFTFLGRRASSTEMFEIGLASQSESFREPIHRRPTNLYARGTRDDQIYFRPKLCLETAANLHGSGRMDAVFQSYFETFAFRHPDFDDFLRVARVVGGEPMRDFIAECFSAPRIPDFVVADLDSRSIDAPLGRVTTSEGLRLVTEEEREELREEVLALLRSPDENSVRMQVVDPGWAHEGLRVDGSVTWVDVEPATAPVPPDTGEDGAGDEKTAGAEEDGEDDEDGGLYESTIRVEGPGWSRLPVEVRFRLEDGTELSDRWDGRATWRVYRVLHRSPVVEARIDPERVVTLDVKPQNNGLLDEPERRLTADWGPWLGAVAQWVASLVTLCL
jgi:hypothetical protein